MNLQELNTEIKSKMEEADRLVRTVGSEAFGQAFKEFFEANPLVKAVRWNQYTPYFNDGEPCEFWCNVSDATVLFSSDQGLPQEAYYLEDDDDDGVWVTPRHNTTSIQAKSINDFIDSISGVEDKIFEAVFGDHVQITATPDGKFEVDEYDHD